MELHAGNLNSYNVCRGFACLESQTKSVGNSAEDLNKIQERATFLVDKLCQMLANNNDVAVLDLYWANQFASNIEKALTKELGSEVGY